jgi:RNA polymerase sigma-54 factor
MTHLLRLEQRPTLTQSLQRSLAILQMPSYELGLFLRKEIEENPLLEDLTPASSLPSTPYVPMDEIPQISSFYETLVQQIRDVMTSPQDLNHAFQFLDHLDEKGFVSEAVVSDANRHVLAILQTLEPAGIFARSLQESFLLQLARQHLLTSKAYQLIAEHFDDLLKQRHQAILKSFTLAEIRTTLKILSKLHPQPRTLFEQDCPPTIRPDLHFIDKEGSWSVELIEEDIPSLHIIPHYSTINPSNQEEHLTLTEWSISAKWLLRSLSRRNTLLLKIGRFLLDRQKAFLESGTVLKICTLQEIAISLSLHESTISRALSGKYVATPRGLLPLSSLLCQCHPKSQEHHRLLQLLIVQESPLKPWTDQELASQISHLSNPIARRTIAKYRAHLKIPSAKQRKLFYIHK